MNKPVQSQQHKAELFQATRQNIGVHLKNIFADNELDRGATDKEYLSVQTGGDQAVNRKVASQARELEQVIVANVAGSLEARG